MSGSGPARRAAVLGKPIEHSRSPDLHRAAYAALGLHNWTYDRIECTEAQLPALVDSLDESFVGLSVTMPGKLAALRHADQCSQRAAAVGSANTLVRRSGGWYADCTDIDGMSGALRAAGIARGNAAAAVVLGAGGTALPTLAALADAGFEEVTVVARERDRAARALELGPQLGVVTHFEQFARGSALVDAVAAADVTVSTIPPTAAAQVADDIAAVTGRLVDVIYDPWPTPLAAAVGRCGGTVVGGLVMLLNQAYRQVELFTGLAAPRAAMDAVLA